MLLMLLADVFGHVKFGLCLKSSRCVFQDHYLKVCKPYQPKCDMTFLYVGGMEKCNVPAIITHCLY